MGKKKIDAGKVIVAKNSRGMVSVFPGGSDVKMSESRTGAVEFTCGNTAPIVVCVPVRIAELYLGKDVAAMEPGTMVEKKWNVPIVGTKKAEGESE